MPRPTDATPSDADLVRQTLAGRRAAFDGLIERYQRRATAVSYRLLGNLHDALEVGQDAFLRAYRSLSTLDEPERFGSWFLRIVTNLSLNFRRARTTRRSRPNFSDCILGDEHSPEEHAADSAASEDRPGARLAADELRAAAQRAIGELPDTQRAALVLFSIEQMPQKEVAEILGCSVEAVKWHVFQARKKLKEQLAEFL